MSKEHGEAKLAGHILGSSLARTLIEAAETSDYCPLCFTMPLLVELAVRALVSAAVDENVAKAFLEEFAETAYLLLEGQENQSVACAAMH